MEKAKVGIITNTAIIFDLRFILLCSFQSLINGPKILHCLTIKGKGYELAEQNQTKWHATSKFDKISGKSKKKNVITPQPPKYQDVFGNTIVELANKNKKIVGITPAMPSGSSMNIMMEKMPIPY